MIEVFCDGGARGNPGPAAYGFVVKVNRRIIYEGRGYLGIATNNIAEYTALVEALSWLREDFRGQTLTIYLDSQLVVAQLSGFYRVKNANLRDMIIKVRQMETDFGGIVYRHISREKNRLADRLVNKALDEVMKIKA